MKGRPVIFKKKKKKQEETDGSDVVESSDAVEEKSQEPDETNKADVSKIDLKNTLVMAVVAVISVACAFIFVTKFYHSKNVYEITNEVEGSAVDDSVNVSKENVEATEEKEKTKEKKKAKEEKSKSKSKKSDADSGNAGKSSSILNKILVPMDSIVVNLGKVDSRRYLRVFISLEVDSAETEKTVTDNKVIFRDKLISFLSTKNPKEIETQDDQLMLRRKIKNTLNKDLFEGNESITQVYFSDFIMQ